MNWMRIRHIVRKEFIQIRRDPKMLRLILVAPVFQLIIFGYGVTTDITNVPTVVVDSDGTQPSRELAARFKNSGYFRLDYHVARPQDMAPLIDAGKAQVGLEIPKGFAKDLALGRSASLQLVIDGSDSTTAGMVLGYTAGILKRFSEDVLADRTQRVRAQVTRLPGIEERTRVWYNPDLKSINFMVPGVLCMTLLVVTMMLTSLAIVKEREIGTLEQLIVTPIKPGELMIAKMIPFIVIGFVDVLLMLVAAWVWFEVPIAGSVPLLLGLTAVFLMTSLGVGLLVSTVSRTQQQAMMTSFFVILPSLLLSGFMFPIENMPRVVQWLTYLLPPRYYLVIIRGIYLKGSGLEVLWPSAVTLLVFGVAVLALSALRFVKKMA